uniref:Transmembrane protein 198 n=1 Tax=Strombidium inclinatum TaxID=197538 RepID=A0A7S3IEP9_9SPIT|mmetsp:Transcript_14591/g.22635  ORF Transcript_14591/g.22635 Transcript_14591/m.22635 type:complete len:294 (+) Transcript_14591:598-1479(+)
MDSDSRKVNGVTLNYVGGNEECEADTSQKYELKVQITCNPDQSTLKYINSEDDTCSVQLNYESKDSCPLFSLNQLAIFLNEYYYLWGAGLIIAGIFVGFFGNHLINGVIFLITATAVFALGTVGIYGILDSFNVETPEWANWVILGAMAILGLIVGYVVKKLRKIGIAIIAAWGGVMLGLALNGVFLVENEPVYYSIIVGCAIIVAVLAFKMEKVVIILVTSFTGAYSVVRGISLYAGGFPSLTQLHQEIKSGAMDWDEFPKTYYAYAGGILVLTLICVLYQRAHNKKKKGHH